MNKGIRFTDKFKRNTVAQGVVTRPAKLLSGHIAV